MDLCEFEVSLFYRVSFTIVMATQSSPVLKILKKKKRKEKKRKKE